MSVEIYAPQKRYADKQAELGMIKISAWVPECMRDRALKYAGKLRAEHLKNQQK